MEIPLTEPALPDFGALEREAEAALFPSASKAAGRQAREPLHHTKRNDFWPVKMTRSFDFSGLVTPFCRMPLVCPQPGEGINRKAINYCTFNPLQPLCVCTDKCTPQRTACSKGRLTETQTMHPNSIHSMQMKKQTPTFFDL